MVHSGSLRYEVPAQSFEIGLASALVERPVIAERPLPLEHPGETTDDAERVSC
jgi:hypothetical protein